MALGDIFTRVITKYEADTSDQIRELTKLKSKITEAQKAELDSHKSREETYQKWLNGITGVNQGLELATKAIGFAKDAWKSYADHLRLTTAAGKTNIEALRTASLGLRTEQELLTFAAQTQNAVIKLSQKDMETAQRAMVALTRAGFDQHEVTEKITQSLVKAKAEGLDDFGLAIKTGKTDLENYTNIMAALAEKASGVQDGTADASESIRQMGVSMSDTMDEIKRSIGEMVNSLQPVVQGLVEAIKFAEQLVDKLPKGALGLGGIGVGSVGAMKINDDLIRAIKGARGDAFIKGDDEVLQAAFQPYFNLLNLVAERIDFENKNHIEFGDDIIKRGKPQGPSSVSSLVRMGGTDVIGGGGFGGSRGGGFGGSLGASAGINVNDQAILQAIIEQIEAMRTGDLTKDWFARLEEQRSQKTSFLESSFGKLEEFNAYQEAFSMLTGSVSAGLNAWVTGSMSAGQAFKKFISDALAGLASQMAVESLKHAAYAIGSAAFGDVKGAATHGAAAVAFGAGAAAAAVAAKGLGGGGGAVTASSGGASGGASAGGRGGAGTGGGNSQPMVTNYFIMGSDYAEDSPRMKQRNAQRIVNLAENKTSAGGAF